MPSTMIEEGHNDEGAEEDGVEASELTIDRQRGIFFAIWGAVGLGAFLLFRAVLLPFLLAAILAYVLAPLVDRMQRVEIRGKRAPRWAAVVLLYIGLLGSLGIFGALGLPRLAAEVQQLAHELPAALNHVREEWIPTLEGQLRGAMAPYASNEATATDVPIPSEDPKPESAATPVVEAIRILPSPGGEGYEVILPEGGITVVEDGDELRITTAVASPEQEDLTAALTQALKNASENTRQHAMAVLHTAQTVIRRLVRGVFSFFIMLMLSAYLLITSDEILAFLRSLVRPSQGHRFDSLLVRIDRGLGGVVRGQLMICLVNGVLSGIGFYLLDLRYWPILTLVATVLSIIPIFGAILSSIPAMIIALDQGIGTVLLVFGWVIVIHQIEANLLNPKIMGDSAKVHPVLVVFALLAGEHLWGVAGALLAVPTLSILQSLFLHYREVALGVVEPVSG